jgi:hypothetical protein
LRWKVGCSPPSPAAQDGRHPEPVNQGCFGWHPITVEAGVVHVHAKPWLTEPGRQSPLLVSCGGGGRVGACSREEAGMAGPFEAYGVELEEFSAAVVEALRRGGASEEEIAEAVLGVRVDEAIPPADPGWRLTQE